MLPIVLKQSSYSMAAQQKNQLYSKPDPIYSFIGTFAAIWVLHTDVAMCGVLRPRQKSFVYSIHKISVSKS